MPLRRLSSSPLRRVLDLALPSVISEVASHGMGLVDTVMVGRLGARPLAAVALGNSLFFPLFLLGLGVLMALDTLIAQAHGAGQEEEAGALLGQGLWLSLALSLPLCLGFSQVHPLLLALGQDPEIARPASAYLGALAWGVPPFLAFTCFRSFFYGLGDTRRVMIVTLLANGVNALANYCLLYGKLGFPTLGVAGLGYATAFSRLFMLLCLVAFAREPRFEVCRPRLGSPDLTKLRSILSLGIPIGALIFFEVGGFSAAALLAGWLGELPLAAHQVVLTLASSTFMVPLGLSIAAAIAVGQEVGRGDPEAARHLGKISLGLAGAFMTCSALAFMISPIPLVRCITDVPAVVAMAVSVLPIVAFFQIFDGMQCVSSGCLRGSGDTRTPMICNLLSFWAVGLPLGYQLAFHLGWGLQGLWLGLATTLTLTGSLLTWIFLRKTCQRPQQIIPKK
jgi:MATE family multidrug resistance protein